MDESLDRKYFRSVSPMRLRLVPRFALGDVEDDGHLLSVTKTKVRETERWCYFLTPPIRLAGLCSLTFYSHLRCEAGANPPSGLNVTPEILCYGLGGVEVDCVKPRLNSI